MQIINLALPVAFVATMVHAAALPISNDLSLESQARDVQNMVSERTSFYFENVTLLMLV